MKYICGLLLLLALISIAGCSCRDKLSDQSIPEKKTAAAIIDSTAQAIEPAAPINTPAYIVTETPTPVISVTPAYVSYVNPDGVTVKDRFTVPEGYLRTEAEDGSFSEFLQNLPLKPNGVKVHYYDGRVKSRDVYLAVVDYPLGDRDLQQCADAVIRLRAEYFYASEQYDNIEFHFVNGFLASFSKWAQGYGITTLGMTQFI